VGSATVAFIPSPESNAAENINARLRALAALKPTTERRAEVEAMLDNKWEGVQTVAAQVLGSWGGRESVAALRTWLARLYERPYSWAARGVAARALALCVTEADVGWALDLYFDQPTLVRRHEIFPILAALPREETVTRLENEARDPDPERREAAARALTWIAAA
jgi:hypothetical protein